MSLQSRFAEIRDNLQLTRRSADDMGYEVLGGLREEFGQARKIVSRVLKGEAGLDELGRSALRIAMQALPMNVNPYFAFDHHFLTAKLNGATVTGLRKHFDAACNLQSTIEFITHDYKGMDDLPKEVQRKIDAHVEDKRPFLTGPAGLMHVESYAGQENVLQFFRQKQDGKLAVVARLQLAPQPPPARSGAL